MKKLIQFILFAGLGIVILTLVYRSQNTAFQEQCRLDGVPSDQCSLINKLLYDFSTVNIGWLLAVVGAFTVSNLFRAIRWQMLHEPMGYHIRLSNSFLTILLGYFANLGLPRMGEVVRPGSLARYENIPMEKVMGTMVIDRLVDFICLILVVGLAFIFQGGVLLDFINKGKSSGSSSSGGGLLSNPIVWVILVLGLLGLVFAWVLRNRLMQLAVFQKFAGIVQGFRDGIRSVFQLQRPGLFIALSAGIWVMFFLQCYWNLKAFEPTAELSAGAALMIFVFGTLGFVIPSPGGMGTFHALCIAGLSLYGVAGGDAFSYANIAFFTIQIFYNVVGGVLALVLLPIINKK